ncbi:MAG TPA: TadE/TadG family type IV pilus assembly protein [Rhizomicrobium sp.]
MRARLKRFRGDKDGMAAVEFAMLLPVLITLFFGVMEVALALACRADVANVASTAADLVAQEKGVAAGDMTNVFAAASAILYPYKTANVTITVYSIVADNNNNATGKVAWSCTKVGDAVAANGPTTPPPDSKGGDMIAASNLDANGNPQYGGSGSVILTTVSYSYTSPTMQVLTKPITMQNTFYSKPRRTNAVTAPDSCAN